MIEQDTVRLLRECDAGIKMGVSAIDEVIEYTQSDDLKNILSRCKDKHLAIQKDMLQLLDEYQDDGKEPNPMAKGMSWLKTNVMLNVKESDKTVADLITDGCNMGVKSLNKYLNEYEAASERVKELTKKIIDLEEKLAIDVRRFL